MPISFNPDCIDRKALVMGDRLADAGSTAAGSASQVSGIKLPKFAAEHEAGISTAFASLLDACRLLEAQGNGLAIRLRGSAGGYRETETANTAFGDSLQRRI